MICISFILDLRRRENAANKAKKNKANESANNSVALADVALRQQQQLLYQEKIIKEQNMKLRQQSDHKAQESRLHQSPNPNGSKESGNTSVTHNNKKSSLDETENISEITINEQNVKKDETVKETEDKNDDYLLLLPGSLLYQVKFII